ncbi:MAG: 2-amino-4-hydroxy-6-hydroxymethyldihydropteridine diphosphokinase [Acidiphilium sp. 37-64-53]|uniref:2-amino-4-hydroxy-6- hydroxymethyldihydropteridine diphosphokinase n=1 Tax=Acidiphilium TaxID=522 RepID=UPI000BD84767|nr:MULTISPECIES: 2-amino-4-hydroxy-6-hydroxymethyldihydropteridine diphosphokinase [Acidiphilium]OYW04172.1 MAG: 2-amino-4-hydroxy-6-hydroxymethyldihydropteridine diphosphokinase [Acidiphilium sp. 37-64-53]OZB31106.1 MAG: 2-amino-4-hydroxy-6-hydroxymethyldihydropteridine diphosphokinase [Acidiphilium sp. 34-64-41]HQT83420.1 2-amino-4-hydroxy-6-hydroxymethyldihydropteridine diphosphokinase [Acidiphilium rubrum]
MLLIAIGANLPGAEGGSPRTTCDQAVHALRNLPDIRFVALSGWYRSAPVPRDDGQPDYCNGVVRFEGEPDPAWLLASLHKIEAEFGRTRSVANAARTLDLDLIDCNGIICTEASLVLPHPRAHLRPFVLQPILDIAPDWVHPDLDLTAAALLAALPQPAAGSMMPW